MTARDEILIGDIFFFSYKNVYFLLTYQSSTFIRIALKESDLKVIKNYREVLRTITRHSTSMISNDTQSSSEYSISQSY